MRKQTASKNAAKVLVLTVLAGLLMGNQSCEKKSGHEVRTLKKVVDVGHIASKPVELPDGKVLDFQFVVNQQFYHALYKSGAFAFRYNPPVEGIGILSDGTVMGRLNLSKASRDFLEKTTGQSADQMA